MTRIRQFGLRSGFAGVIGLFGLVATISFATSTLAASPGAAAAGSYPADLKAAATGLEAATAKGGAGYSFTVEQRQTEDALPGGPQIALFGPDDQANPNGHTGHWYVNATLARGHVTGDAFWMEMRSGPGESVAANFDQAPPLWAVIYRDSVVWRNDGAGWYQVEASPGTGMDPMTAARLPGLLRRLTSLVDSGKDTLPGGVKAHHYTGVADVADFPGVVASDAAPFTDKHVSVEVWIDESGRLVRLEGKARNLNETDYDLHVDTVVDFSYDAAAVPDPVPTAGPSALPIP